MKQDSIQHPFLIPLRQWAECAFYYPFGSDMGKNNLGVILEGADIPLDFHNSAVTVGVFRRGMKTFGDPFKNNIIGDMQKIGYELENIQLEKPLAFAGPNVLPNLPSDPVSICVKEAGLSAPVDQLLMSQGCFGRLLR
jgi:hypothetical protein